MNKIASAMMLLAAVAGGAVHAKLPTPSEEAKAAAAAAKDKAAWADKLSAFQLCLVQDKIAGNYFKEKPTAPKPTVAIPACTNPGPYVAQVAAASQVGVADSKPVPAAGKPEPAGPVKK